MNRSIVITIASFTLLALIGAAHLYETSLPDTVEPIAARPSPPPTPESRALSLQEVAEAILPGVEEGAADLKAAALGHLLSELESAEFSKTPLSEELGERVAKALSASFAAAGEGPDGPALQRRIVAFLASRTRGPTTREFVGGLLKEGPAGMRTAALSSLGRPQGLRGRALYSELASLSGTGIVDLELPGALRRTGGAKAVESLTALIKSTDNARLVASAAVALQDLGRPELMGLVLQRMEETGLLDTPKGIPWIDRKQFSAFMEKAEGVDFGRGLKLVKSRPSLIAANMGAIVRGLECADPGLRQASAEAIKRAIAAKKLDPKKGSELLTGRLERELEPVLRAELAGGIESARQLMEETPETSQQ